MSFEPPPSRNPQYGGPAPVTPIVMVGDKVQLFRTFSQPQQQLSFGSSSSGGRGTNKRSPDPDEPYETLESLLYDYSIEHADENEENFWPFAQLRLILTPERVLRALEQECGFDPTTAAECFDRIFPAGGGAIAADAPHPRWLATGASGDNARSGRGAGGYLRIFALLTLLGKGELLPVFIDQSISDNELPLERGGSRKGVPELARPVPPLPKPRSWFRSNDARYFLDTQWHMLPTFFAAPAAGEAARGAVPHYDLPFQAVLPWVEIQSVDGRQATFMGRDEGGSGLVRRVKIDPDCHDLHEILGSISSPNQLFAIKSLRKKNLAQFTQEVEMLKRFNGRAHPHLVTLLATFTHRELYHFVFPWAECDLDEWWARCRTAPNATHDFMLWLARQVSGLAEALHVIHEPKTGGGSGGGSSSHLLPTGGGGGEEERKFGRHGDLKPENILWFAKRDDPMGMLVISDFGISAVHRDVSRSNVPNEDLPRTPTYRPPECDIEGGKIARAFDVWTIGCLLLELACWLLGGADARARFKQERMTMYLATNYTDIYFDIQEKEADEPGAGEGSGKYVFLVKESVMQYMERLHRDPACTQFVHDLLNLIHDDMLVVMSPTRQRIRSGPLTRRLERMRQRAASSPDYVLSRAPWRNHTIARPPAVEAQLIEHTRSLLRGQESLRKRLAVFSSASGATEMMSTMQFTDVQGD